MADLKIKAGQFKDEAEQAINKAPEYFEKLKTEAGAALKDSFPDVDAFLQELFGKAKVATETPAAEEPKA